VLTEKEKKVYLMKKNIKICDTFAGLLAVTNAGLSYYEVEKYYIK